MLNDRQITLIKPPEKGRKSYGDINGLSLRVTSTNHKVGVFSIVLMVVKCD